MGCGGETLSRNVPRHVPSLVSQAGNPRGELTTAIFTAPPKRHTRSMAAFATECRLQHVQVFKSRGGIENQHFIGCLDPFLLGQVTEGSDTGSTFGAEKNSFCPSYAGNLR